MKLDFITVVYDREIDLLQWQAKSFSKYIDPEIINRIIVVDNGSQTCSKDIKKTWYGDLKEKVKIINHKDLDLMVFEWLDGWRTQQICKILAATQSTTEWSLILDAKTFFAKTLNINELFDKDRPCVGYVGVSEHWTDSKKYLEDFYKIKIPFVLGPGGVPFFFHTETVKALVNEIPNFNNWFQELLYERTPPHRLLITEFMLYSAFVLKKFNAFEKLYSDEKKITTFNISAWELLDDFDKFEQIFYANSHAISIDGRAKKLLNKEQLQKWEKFLHDKYN